MDREVSMAPGRTPTRSLARRLGERKADLRRLTVRRILAVPPIVLACSFVVFALAAASPLDPVSAYLGDGYLHASDDQRAGASAAIGADEPFLSAWWAWLTRAIRGDFGISHTFSQPVAQVIGQRLGWTALLAAVGLVLALVVATTLAAVAAARPGRLVDRALTGAILVLGAVPPFVVALAMVAVFAVGLGWLPSGGVSPPGESPSPAAVAAHLVLPAVVLASSQVPWMALSAAESAREASAGPAARAARLRGLPSSVVIGGHVLPAVVAPFAALTGTRLPELLVGAIIVESVFSWPGLAAATVDGALSADLALLAAVSTLTALGLCVGSWAADAIALLADPRVRADA